jgi:hypothetical protein
MVAVLSHLVEFTAPVRIESEMNRRDHWSVRRKRFQIQKRAVYYSWPNRWVIFPLPLVVTLTRIGPRKLDTDNLASGFKGVRDQIAAILCCDDGNPELEWRYAQDRGAAHEYAIRVTIDKATASRP